MDLELFLTDLEGRFDAERREQADAVVAELADAERGSVTLAARLLACAGKDLTVLVRGGERASGPVRDVARTWVLLGTSGGASLVPLAAVVAVWPLGGGTVDEEAVANSVGVGHVLRELAGRRADVVVDHDAGVHQGKIHAVYQDHVDVEVRTGTSGVDARDRGNAVTMSLSLAGIRRIRAVGAGY